MKTRRSFIKTLAAASVLPAMGPSETKAAPVGVTISLKQFIEWLQTFMVFGSDQKEMICDPVSWNAIIAIGDRPGFRFFRYHEVNGVREDSGENGRFVMSPFGWVLIRNDESANGITVIDPRVRHRRQFGMPNQSHLEIVSESSHESILKIVA